MQDGKQNRTIREAVHAAAGLQPASAFMLSAETGPTVTPLELMRNCILPFSMPHNARFERGDNIAFPMDNDLMEHNGDLFDEKHTTRMPGHCQAVLESATSDAAGAVSQLEILPDAEYRKVVYEWNATEAPYHSDTFVHRLIEAQAARAPAATALVFDDAPMSYAELNLRANQLAHHLRTLGVKPDARVAVCAERSFEMVIALLAVLKAGGAYVPFDPTYPAERLRFMIDDAEPVVLLTQPHLKSLFATLDGSLPVIDLTESSIWSQMPASDPDPDAIGLTPQQLAYVIYTSGSTGKPKGVMVQHQGLCNRFDWMQSVNPMHSSDAMLQKTPFTFDVSLEEFFPPLMAGSRLVIARPEGHKDPAYLAGVIAKNRITIAHFVPSMLHVFLECPGSASCTSLKRVVCSGEALPAPLAQRFQQQMPGVELHNLYGPTEATVEVTAWKCPENFNQSVVPIGRPIANTRMYILDEQQQPVPVGVPGELYIAGVQVARGYLNCPELTAEKFLADPFTTGPDARMYRTGDLARWMSDGNIEYLGRNDFQVKIHGFRIELGEIENELLRHAGVRQCVVTAQGDDAEKRLVAYLVPRDANHAPSVEDLRATLQRSLPGYMVPSVFAFIDAIPLTPNGKTDIKKLMQLEVRAAQRETPVEAPRDDVESKLVQIWERVLDVRPIGIHNNFFDVGGYSLMIMKLFTQINKAFDRALPIATIFRYPTIEQLATLIRGSAIQSSALVPLRSRGSKAPLFIVHSYLTYERFRQMICEDHPLYGLHEPEDDDQRIATVHERVNEYARLIRETQPEGPYNLIGWCASGAITVEIARKLQELGGKVAMVGLIDAAHPRYLNQMLSERANANHVDRFQEWRDYHLQRFERFERVGRIRYFAGAFRQMAIDRTRRAILHYGDPLFRLCARVGIKIPRFVDHLASVRIENPQPYPGKITLFRALETNRAYRDPTLGWRDLAVEGVNVVWTPGNHETMFIEGNVVKFGQLVEEIMDGKGSRSEDTAAQSVPLLGAAAAFNA